MAAHNLWIILWTTWNVSRYSPLMTAVPSELSPSRRIAAEVRAEMARRGLSARALALKIDGVSYMWVNRRIGMNADQDLTFEELELIANALGVSATKLVTDAHWLPRLDSNQQPSGYRARIRRVKRRRPDLLSPTGVTADVKGAA